MQLAAPHVEGTSADDGDQRSTHRLFRIDRVNRNRGPLIVVAVSLLVYVFLALSAISERAPLYWDEAVYANRGRFFAGELDNGVGYWAGYRAPGLPFLIGLGFRVLHPSELLVRLPVFAFGVLLLLLVFALGSLLVDVRVGAAATAVMAFSTAFTRFSAYAVPDVPGTAIGLGAVVVALWAWRDGPLRPIAYVAVPALTAATTYMRFGAPISLGIGLLATVVFVGMRQWRSRGGAFAREVVVLGALALLPMVLILTVPTLTAQDVGPYAARQRIVSGRGIPIIDSVGETVAILWPDGGRFDFFQPAAFWTIVALTIVGLVAVRIRTSLLPAVSFCAIGLVLTVVALNITLDHMETRYLMVGLPYLAVVAGVGAVTLWDGARSAGRAAAIVAIVGVIVIGAFGLRQSREYLLDHAERLEASMGMLQDAGYRLQEVDDPDCVIVSGRGAQFGWYTQCRATQWAINSLDRPVLEQLRTRAQLQDDPKTVYVIDIAGHDRQPDTSVFDETDIFVPVAEVGDPNGRRVRVLRVDDCVLADTCDVGSSTGIP